MTQKGKNRRASGPWKTFFILCKILPLQLNFAWPSKAMALILRKRSKNDTMKYDKEFALFARDRGISSLSMHRYTSMFEDSISPMIIEERKMNMATMDVFSRLMMDRILFLGCAVCDNVANILQAQILFLESTDPDSDIQMYINSPGGSVSAGLGIYDTMQLISSDVATICTGMAASMGAILLTAGTKGKRSALKHSRIMIHQPLGGAEGPASDIEITARQILKTKDDLYKILSEHTGNSVKKIAEHADRDFWMTSQEAVDYGLIDKVQGKRTEKKKNE